MADAYAPHAYDNLGGHSLPYAGGNRTPCFDNAIDDTRSRELHLFAPLKAGQTDVVV